MFYKFNYLLIYVRLKLCAAIEFFIRQNLVIIKFFIVTNLEIKILVIGRIFFIKYKIKINPINLFILINVVYENKYLFKLISLICFDTFLSKVKQYSP